MQNIDASAIPVQWSVSWDVASKADASLSSPSRPFPKLDRFRESAGASIAIREQRIKIMRPSQRSRVSEHAPQKRKA